MFRLADRRRPQPTRRAHVLGPAVAATLALDPRWELVADDRLTLTSKETVIELEVGDG